jgi:hypothetical protein
VTPPHEGNPPYTVDMSQTVRLRVRELHLEAARSGGGPAFLQAYREIVQRLENEPMQFGEPSFHLRGLHLQIRRASILPLVVDYGVHLELPLVFIRHFRLLSSGRSEG